MNISIFKYLNIRKEKQNRGFVILFAVTLSSILLAIALGVTNIALKELKFGTSARDTNDAFFAADTGIEYVLFTDKPPTSPYVPSPGTAQTWNPVIYNLGSNGKSCAKISVTKDNTTPPFTSTSIVSKGYNLGGDSSLCVSSNPDRIEREIKVSFGGGFVPPSGNQNPVANAGPDKAITLPTSSSAPTSTSASDPDGSVVSTIWSFFSGPSTPTITNGSTLAPSFSNMTVAGSYVFRLTATDNLGAVGADDMSVVVSSGSSDTIWVGDSLPAGASPVSDGDNWTWVASNPAPFSGSLSHKSNLVSSVHQHYFMGATATLPIVSGDKLVTYIYLDSTNPPSEVMIQWNNGNWEHRAYWGSNVIGLGTNGTDSRRYMGVLPATGQWVRLEVPASQVGLVGSTLNGMAFTLYGGQASWDHSGKTQ